MTIRDPDLHLEATGDAVERLEHARRFILRMLMQIDETRSHHQSLRIHRASSGEWLRRDARDAPLVDADVHGRVQSGFRIQHAPPRMTNS